jgi:hypothetical protein
MNTKTVTDNDNAFFAAVVNIECQRGYNSPVLCRDIDSLHKYIP